MLRFATALAVLVALAAAAPLLPTTGEVVPNEYIVVFHANASVTAIHRQISAFVASREHHQVLHVYTAMSTFKGFAAHLTPSLLQHVLANPEVDYVERNTVVHAAAACTRQFDAEWNLDRIDERDITLTDDTYSYDTTAGDGIDAYIVDTGIYPDNLDFTPLSRVLSGGCFITNCAAENGTVDQNGHGTHVASTIGGVLYGVSKKPFLIAVKVLGRTGSGTNAGVIAGVDFVAQTQRNRRRPSVANMSLGGGISTATDQAVRTASETVTFAIAAGNSNNDACNGSPARVGGNNGAKGVLTVMATTIESMNGRDQDTRSYFSSFGTCTDIAAPGTLIKAAWIGGNRAVNTISGTSMATPHVAGAAALLLDRFPSYTPAQVKAALIEMSTPAKINLACGTSAACAASPNRLLFVNCKYTDKQ